MRVAAAGEDLVRIALVADVPDDAVVGRVVEVVQRDGQFHGAQAGGEMAGGARHAVDQELAQLAREPRQLASAAGRAGRPVSRSWQSSGIAVGVGHCRVTAGRQAGRGWYGRASYLATRPKPLKQWLMRCGLR